MVNYIDLEIWLFRLILIYNKRQEILDEKRIGVELKTLSFPNGLYEVREVNNILESINQKT